MLLTTFIVTIIFIILAAIFIGSGLVRLHNKSYARARGVFSTGFMLALLGIVIAAFIFNFGNI
jgi:hypothetical protein